jgi:hypothetical protein
LAKKARGGIYVLGVLIEQLLAIGNIAGLAIATGVRDENVGMVGKGSTSSSH